MGRTPMPSHSMDEVERIFVQLKPEIDGKHPEGGFCIINRENLQCVSHRKYIEACLAARQAWSKPEWSDWTGDTCWEGPLYLAIFIIKPAGDDRPNRLEECTWFQTQKHKGKLD